MARRKGLSAFSKTIVRGIRDSLGRFLAIMGIVALGCGFYAGLQMCGPDMRAGADALYDGTGVYDLRLVSTLGFAQDDLDRVVAASEADDAMASITVDAMARMDSDQLVVRISSLDTARADASEVLGDAIPSVAPGYLNRPFLREGRWPAAADECVVGADKEVARLALGDTVEVLYGVADLDGVLRSGTFRVVGTVSSPIYPYTGSFGSTTLGSGMVSEYLYVAEAAFVDDTPFTELFLHVPGSDELESGSDAYQALVDTAVERIEDQKTSLAAARLEDIRADAEDELEEGRRTYEQGKADADRELADAQAELARAADQLEEGERTYASGKARYDEGVAELARQRTKAHNELASAERELARGTAQLEEGKAALSKSKAAYAQGVADYEAGLRELLAQTGATSLDEAQSTLQAQKAEAERAAAALATAHDGASGIVDGNGQLATRWQEVAQGRTTWQAGVDQLLAAMAAQGLSASTVDAAIAQLETALASAPEGSEQAAALQALLSQAQALATTDAQLTSAEQELAAAQERLDASEQNLIAMLASQGIAVSSAAEAVGAVTAAQASVADGLRTVDEGLAAVDKLASAQTELEAGERRLGAASSDITASERRLAAGRTELESQRAQAWAALASAQGQLDDAAAELSSASARLSEGRSELAAGQEAYEQARADASKELAEAAQKLDDAQESINGLEAPELHLLDRSKNEGMLTYDADSRRMDSIADVFPLIFFLVAALVALTTMTRMVDDDRVEIGTYKALGYSTARIAGKYLVYAGLAATAGATVGILALSQVLPYIVTSAYSVIYAVPLRPLPLPVDLGIAFASGGLGVGVTLLATWGAVVKSLREVPATLMLPRAPAAGKRILLERLGPVWRRLSFSRKVTFRNLFRYKRRLAMTVIGISGCAALLLVGFGLHDSIWDIIDRQYGPIVHYNTTVGLVEEATDADVREALRYLRSTGFVDNTMRVQQKNIQAGVAPNEETLRVQAIIPQDSTKIAQALTLRERRSGEGIPFDDSSVVVTEKLALKYGLAVGDEILLFDQDDIGNVTGEGHPLVITGVTENYVGNNVYVGIDAWKAVDGAAPVFSTIYATTDQDEATRAAIEEELHAQERVSLVAYSDETIEMYRSTLSVVDTVVVLLIVSAGLLAFIVLYNLTNINIDERSREIASLKVLGFTKGEVYAYIFREIALLALLGDALGMALGSVLETFVVTTAEIDFVMFGRDIHPTSYLYAFVLTLVFTALILMAMRGKLDRIDMVESLKSVD